MNPFAQYKSMLNIVRWLLLVLYYLLNQREKTSKCIVFYGQTTEQLAAHPRHTLLQSLYWQQPYFSFSPKWCLQELNQECGLDCKNDDESCSFKVACESRQEAMAICYWICHLYAQPHPKPRLWTQSRGAMDWKKQHQTQSPPQCTPLEMPSVHAWPIHPIWIQVAQVGATSQTGYVSWLFFSVFSSTVGIAHNLKTWNLSLQYHLVYDGWFEMIHTSVNQEPKTWN